MLRIALLVLALMVVVSPAPAEAKVRCSSGTTAFVSGDLRIFGVHYSTPDEWGFDEYACLGRDAAAAAGRRRGVDHRHRVGRHARLRRGARRAAAGRLRDRATARAARRRRSRCSICARRRAINFMNVACCDGVPAFRVTSAGAIVLLSAGEDLVVKERGHARRAVPVARRRPTDLATSGDTVYWYEGGAAKTTTLAVADTGRMLEPVRLRRRGGPCAAMRGRTIAASGSVRVVRRGGRHVACRIGLDGRFRVGTAGDPAPSDRRRPLAAPSPRERASRSSTHGPRRAVTTAGPAAAADLLRDGTLAWLDEGGRLARRRPGRRPVVLAAARRHHASPPPAGRSTGPRPAPHTATAPDPPPVVATAAPHRSRSWHEFHRRISALPTALSCQQRRGVGARARPRRR